MAASTCAVLPPDDAKTSPSEVAMVNESREYFSVSARRLCWKSWQFSRRSGPGSGAASGCGFLTGLDTGIGRETGMGFTICWYARRRLRSRFSFAFFTVYRSRAAA